MTARIITYRSLNCSDPKEQWMGFVEINRDRLGIFFPAPTEEEAKAKVRAFWAREKEKQERAEANAAARAEAMRAARASRNQKEAVS